MVEMLRHAERQGLDGDHPRRLLSLSAAGEDAGARQRLEPTSAEALSQRELEVLRLLDTELTGPEIARELFVSQNTLRTHTKHIFTKLEVTTRRAAVRRGRERGLM
jgi:LuxR family maltose regulon positive regulatory protein